MAVCLCSSVHICKMLRDACVGVKAVDDVEQLRQRRSLLRQISRRTAADNQHIHCVLVLLDLGNRINRDAGGQELDSLRCAAGEYTNQLHIIVLTDGKLNTLAQVTIACNTNSDFAHGNYLHFQNKSLHVYYSTVSGICKEKNRF